MKKKLVILLFIICALSLAGCGEKEKSDKKDKKESTENADDSDTATSSDYEANKAALDKIFETKTDYKATDYVDLCEYKGVEVNTYVSDEEVQERINSLLEQTIRYEEIKDRAVKDGDVINLDYKGTMDGVAFDGGTAQGQSLTIGSGSFIDGFEDQLIGAKVGETFDINVTFPDEYPNNPDLAGKPAVFTVTVNYIQGDQITNEYNDEFVQYVSENEYKTTDDYSEKLKDDIYNEKKDSLTDNAFIYVLDNSPVKDTPQFLVDLMRLRIDCSYKSMAKQYSYDDYEKFIQDYFGNTMDEYNTQIDTMAKEYVEQQLVTKAIAEKENIKVTDEEYQEQLVKYMEGNNIENEVEMEKFAIENYGSHLEDLINESIILNKVLEVVGNNAVEINDPAKVTEKPKDTEEAE